MPDSETPAPLGYDFFADVEGARSVAHTLEAGIRFATLLNALERLERTLYGLPARLQVAHERGAVVSPALGEAVTRQTQRLQRAATQTRDLAEQYRASLQPRVEALWAQIEANDARIAEDGYEAHAATITAAKQEADTLKARMEAAEETVHDAFQPLANEVRALEQRVTRLEKALDELARATFALRPGEALVAATDGRYLVSKREQAEGLLFLTTERLLFEQREEVVRRARFLPISRTERVEAVRLDVPVAQVQGVSTGEHEGASTLDVRLGGEAPVERATFVLPAEVERWRRLLDGAHAAEHQALTPNA